METYLFWLVPIASILALAFAGYFYKQMMRESEGSPEMQKIAAHVRKGAMSYLKQQYKVVTLVFIGLVILFAIMAYGFNLQNHWIPYRRILLGTVGLSGNENCDLCFGTYCQCCTQFTERRATDCFPKRSSNGTRSSRTRVVRHFLLVYSSGQMYSGRCHESDC